METNQIYGARILSWGSERVLFASPRAVFSFREPLFLSRSRCDVAWESELVDVIVSARVDSDSACYAAQNPPRDLIIRDSV